MVLVETRRDRLAMRGRHFDDIAFYSSDPRFADLWRHYHETRREGSIRIFLRDGVPDVDPWRP